MVVFLFVVALVGTVIFGWMTIRRGLNARDNPSRLETYIAKTARSPILFNNRIQSLCLSALIISALCHFIDFVQRSLEALAASF